MAKHAAIRTGAFLRSDKERVAGMVANMHFQRSSRSMLFVVVLPLHLQQNSRSVNSAKIVLPECWYLVTGKEASLLVLKSKLRCAHEDDFLDSRTRRAEYMPFTDQPLRLGTIQVLTQTLDETSHAFEGVRVFDPIFLPVLRIQQRYGVGPTSTMTCGG